MKLTVDKLIYLIPLLFFTVGYANADQILDNHCNDGAGGECVDFAVYRDPSVDSSTLTSFKDHIEITSGNFTTGDDYLIMAQTWIGGTDVNSLYEIQTLHGDEDQFNACQQIYEPNANVGASLRYNCTVIWTAVSGEGIKIIYRVWGGSGSHDLDNGSIIIVNLDDATNLVPNDFGVNVSSVDYLNIPSFPIVTNTTLVTLPIDDDVWLFGNQKQRVDAVGRQLSCGFINLADSLLFAGNLKRATEDLSEVRNMQQSAIYADTRFAAGDKISQYCYTGGNTEDIIDGQLSWLYPQNFTEHFIKLTGGGGNPDSTNNYATSTEQYNQVIKANYTSPYLFVGSSASNVNGVQGMKYSYRLNGTEFIGGHEANNRVLDFGWASSDWAHGYQATILNLTAGENYEVSYVHTASATSPATSNPFDFLLISLSNEFGTTVTVSDEIAIEDTVSTIESGVVTVSDKIAFEDIAITSLKNFDTVIVTDEIAVEDIAITGLVNFDTVTVNDEVAFEDVISTTGSGVITVSDEIAFEDIATTGLTNFDTVTVSDEIAVEDLGASTVLRNFNTVIVTDEIAVEDSTSNMGAGTVTVSDEIAFEEVAQVLSNIITVSDVIALEDEMTENIQVAGIFNTVFLSLNSPLADRLGGVFAITCPSNHTMTGIFSNGTAICTDLSDFFP